MGCGGRRQAPPGFACLLRSSRREVHRWQTVVPDGRRRPGRRSPSFCRQQTPAAGAHRANRSQPQDLLAEFDQHGSSNLRLPPRIHDLQIDYTALSLVLPEKVRFKYKLEGQDRDWRRWSTTARCSIQTFRPIITASASLPAITAACGTRRATCSTFPSIRHIIRRAGSSLAAGGFLRFTLGAVSLPPASAGTGIQCAAGRAGRRAHAHRPRTARHAVAELSGVDAALSRGSQPASPGRSQGGARKRLSNGGTRRSPRAGMRYTIYVPRRW